MTTIPALIAALDVVVDRVEADTQDIQSRLPAALVSGAMDADVSAMQANVIASAAIAADALVTLAENQLKYDFDGITGEAARSQLNAMRALRNKITLTGTALSVKKEDDSTEAWAATATLAARNPVTEVDPA